MGYTERVQEETRGTEWGSGVVTDTMNQECSKNVSSDYGQHFTDFVDYDTVPTKQHQYYVL